MPTPEVLSFREFRAGLAENFRRVQDGVAVYVGPHRKPEAVLTSVAHYEDIVEISRQRAMLAEALAQALGSLRAEGLEPSTVGVAACRPSPSARSPATRRLPRSPSSTGR